MALRGRVDFYLWKGIVVARSWPKPSNQPRMPGSVESSNRFTVYTKLTGMIDPLLRDDYKRFHGGQGVTWVDSFRATAGGKSWVRFS